MSKTVSIPAEPTAAANVPPTLPAVKPEPTNDAAAEGKLYLVKRTIVYQGPGKLHDQFVYAADNARLTFDHLSGAELALLLKRGIIAP